MNGTTTSHALPSRSTVAVRGAAACAELVALLLTSALSLRLAGVEVTSAGNECVATFNDAVVVVVVLTGAADGIT